MFAVFHETLTIIYLLRNNEKQLKPMLVGDPDTKKKTLSRKIMFHAPPGPISIS